MLDDLDGDPELSEWEFSFIRSNARRTEFTDAQKEVVARLMEKFEV